MIFTIRQSHVVHFFNMQEQAISVGAYLSLLNETLRAFASPDIAIEGEVSDYHVSQQKWISFDLKDEKEEAVLKCFATVWQIHTPIENGMRVVIRGVSRVYERYGQLKFTVQEITPVGEGALRRTYELLKKQLEAEGLFDVSHKRPLPRFPKRIGLMTSKDAAAYGDFLRILHNRWSGVEILHANIHVQGKEAVGDILGAFRYFNTLSSTARPEVLVLTRGGGGLEDLQAFNDEQVARAVFQSKIPVVCAVGHERDESLCDFVADVRASTPSNAAERVVPDREDMRKEIEMMIRQQTYRLETVLQEGHHLVDHTARVAELMLEREQQRSAQTQERFFSGQEHWIRALGDQLQQHLRLLQQVDPKRVLARGYSLVTMKGTVVKNTTRIVPGSEVEVQLAQGSFDAEVLRVNGKGKQSLFTSPL